MVATVSGMVMEVRLEQSANALLSMLATPRPIKAVPSLAHPGGNLTGMSALAADLAGLLGTDEMRAALGRIACTYDGGHLME